MNNADRPSQATFFAASAPLWRSLRSKALTAKGGKKI
jgi:hypothetical protein